MREAANQRSLHAGYDIVAPDLQQTAAATINMGAIPSARLIMSSQPSANDTIGIGATTFKFVASLGAAVAQVQVLIGANAAATQASLVKAINGTVSAAEWVEATTPFAVAVLADSVSTSVRIRQATARGGVAKAGVSGSIALAEGITPAADIWTNGNLNETGMNPALQNEASGSFVVSAQMVTAMAAGATIPIELSFTPTFYSWGAMDTNGGIRNTLTDRMAISGNALVVSKNSTTNLAATDIVTYWACG